MQGILTFNQHLQDLKSEHSSLTLNVHTNSVQQMIHDATWVSVLQSDMHVMLKYAVQTCKLHLTQCLQEDLIANCVFGEPKSEAYIVLNRPLGSGLVNAAITEAD